MNSRHLVREALVSRRRFALAAAIGGLLPAIAAGHSRAGPVVPPTPCPSLRMTSAAGPAVDLRRTLVGKVTAVQLMFTGCSATCPIQGAIFADAQGRIAAASARVQLLSISIDVVGDDSSRLQGWLARHAAQRRRWTAAVAHSADLDPLLAFLRGGNSAGDSHPTHVYLFDRLGRLVFVTPELPPGAQVANLLLGLDAQG